MSGDTDNRGIAAIEGVKVTKFEQRRKAIIRAAVGVIGTGSSGIQCIPLIARQAKHMHVFQQSLVNRLKQSYGVND